MCKYRVCGESTCMLCATLIGTALGCFLKKREVKKKKKKTPASHCLQALALCSSQSFINLMYP